VHLNLLLATIHPSHPSEALTLSQALIAFTRGSAHAEFEDQRKGTQLTMVSGRVVWDSGVLHPTP
jgi:predicted amidohydrolase YtcJ